MAQILAVADLHFNRTWFEWLTAHSPGFDALVIAGDLLNAFDRVPIRAQARVCREWLLELPVGTIVVSGNHDHYVSDPRASVDTSAEGGWVRHLRGKGRVVAVDGDLCEISGVSIATAGWLKPRWPECDVVVYHAPPAGCAAAGNEDGRDYGDGDATDYLQEVAPRLFLSGHIHRPKRRWCWWPVIDPGTLVLVPGVADNGAPAPWHWIVDTGARVATHSEGDVVAW